MQHIQEMFKNHLDKEEEHLLTVGLKWNINMLRVN